MSKINLFLNEFTGIPGIKVEANTPTKFSLVDSNCGNTNTPIKGISVEVDKSITFKAYIPSLKDSLYGQYYILGWYNLVTIDSLDVDNYKEFSIIDKFVTAYLNKFNVLRDIDPTYEPSLSWLNIALKMNLISVGEEELKTTYLYKNGDKILGFVVELPANDLVEKAKLFDKEHPGFCTKKVTKEALQKDAESFINLVKSTNINTLVNSVDPKNVEKAVEESKKGFNNVPSDIIELAEEIGNIPAVETEKEEVVIKEKPLSEDKKRYIKNHEFLSKVDEIVNESPNKE